MNAMTLSFANLCALAVKTARSVAKQLLIIFCLQGAPHILQSDYGRGFVNEVINELASFVWVSLLFFIFVCVFFFFFFGGGGGNCTYAQINYVLWGKNSIKVK